MTPATPAEPSLERLANPVKRYFLATRPAFLCITFAAAHLHAFLLTVILLASAMVHRLA